MDPILAAYRVIKEAKKLAAHEDVWPDTSKPPHWTPEKWEAWKQHYVETMATLEPPSTREKIYRGMVLSPEVLSTLPENQNQWGEHILNLIRNHPDGTGGLGEWWFAEPGHAKFYAKPDAKFFPKGSRAVLMSGEWDTNLGEDNTQTHSRKPYDVAGQERILGAGTPITLHSLQLDGQELLQGSQEEVT